MSPKLNPGDRLVALRKYPPSWLKKNQIVVIRPWILSAGKSRVHENRQYIKRIFALEDEIIFTRVDDLPDFLSTDNDFVSKHNAQGLRKWIIPKKHFFVTADKPKSFDSLVWGPISFEAVVAVVLAKVSATSQTKDVRVIQEEYTSGRLVLGTTKAGDKIASFDVMLLNGRLLKQEEFQPGDKVFIFLSPGCIPGISYLEELNRELAKSNDQDPDMFLVCDSSLDATREFIEEHDIRLKVIVSPKIETSIKAVLGVFTEPSYWVVSENGVLLENGLLDIAWRNRDKKWKAEAAPQSAENL